jgi:phage tail sheath protein FI
MAEQFLHGVEVLDIDAGPRSIRTVKSAVIGIIGTAPNSQQEVKATLVTGTLAANNAIKLTSKLLGVIGNGISVRYVKPQANNAVLGVVVAGRNITVNLATGATGLVTSTAALVIAAITGNTAAAAMVTAANNGASSGAGLMLAQGTVYLSGGIDEAFPLNTPVLIAGSRKEAALLDVLGTQAGTLPVALDQIFDQAGAAVIVVRVDAGASDTETLANIIGGVNAGTGQFLGVQAFIGAESILGFSPRILLAPGFTHQRVNGNANAVVAELVGIATRLRAVICADGPDTTDADAVQYAGDWGSKRVYLCDPGVKRIDSNGDVVRAFNSPVVAGLIAQTDNTDGFWWSPSNRTINGIVGTSRAIDFQLGDVNSRANLLNEKNIATIIRSDGYRLWGNRTLSADPKWAFLNVVRTADMINDSILRAHRWAVDRNITKTYVQDVTESVNAYLRTLVALGAILGGKCWADPDLNSPSEIAQGKVYFDFDFTAPAPAEHITFRSHLVNDYLKEVF